MEASRYWVAIGVGFDVQLTLYLQVLSLKDNSTHTSTSFKCHLCLLVTLLTSKSSPVSLLADIFSDKAAVMITKWFRWIVLDCILGMYCFGCYKYTSPCLCCFLYIYVSANFIPNYASHDFQLIFFWVFFSFFQSSNDILRHPHHRERHLISFIFLG